MIDSHAHLIWESYNDDIDLVIERATQAGVTSFIHPCVVLDDLPKMQNLQKRFSQIHIAAGVHPCDAHLWPVDGMNKIESLGGQIVAIGETGLDYYHKDVAVEIQEKSFREQIQIAKKLDLPLIVHCRHAFEDTLKILREEKANKGVMHCYTGDAEYAAKYWELGFYVSFSGCLTYKSAKQLREDAAKIPLKRTLIETDCPFLAPQKFRGQRNEPAFLPEILQQLADVHGMATSEVEEITISNTKKLFGI
jgi:TatD DNase family protein